MLLKGDLWKYRERKSIADYRLVHGAEGIDSQTATMSHTNPREDVEQLIAGLRTACRRPLFEEIVHSVRAQEDHYHRLTKTTTTTPVASNKTSAPKRMDSHESWNHVDDDAPIPWEKLSWAEVSMTELRQFRPLITQRKNDISLLLLCLPLQ